SSAVGINMTFLFAYSMLRRKWGAEYQGMIKFDLAAGMFIPFSLVVSCVVIASTSQFHTVPHPGFVEGSTISWEPTQAQANQYNQMLENRVLYEFNEANLSQTEIESQIAALGNGDRNMAATLVTRDAFALASSLQPLLGKVF